MTGKYLRLIQANCSDTDVFDFDPTNPKWDSRSKKIGHLIRFSFPSAQKEMVQDLSLRNPERPEVTDLAVGVINYIGWDGAPGDQVELGTRISFQNKAILQEALLSLTNEMPIIEAQFVIYDYDFHAKSFFKRFYTIKDPIKFIIPDGRPVDLSEDPEYDKKPTLFYFGGILAPIGENQKVGYAFSATGPKFTREIGESRTAEMLTLFE